MVIADIQNYLALFLSALRRRGLLTTLKIAFYELYFDWKYDIETKEYIETEFIDSDSVNKQEGHKYGPLQIPFFYEVFGENSQIKDRGCYIDFGCGKGRTLILAALCGFKEIIGVEYSKELCAQCVDNIKSFQEKAHIIANFKVECSDAVDYAIPAKASTVVFYDPFSIKIFEKVLANIKESLLLSPRAVYLVYFNYSAAHKELLIRHKIISDDQRSKTIVCQLCTRA